jgi:hypothetical protein
MIVFMRLIVRLRAIENVPYEMQYHYHLQGFIYNLLRGSVYYDHVIDLPISKGEAKRKGAMVKRFFQNF